MTFDQFIDKWIGKKADHDNYYGGQCVDLFRFYVSEVLGLSQPKGVVGAKNFWGNYETDPILKNNFTKISNTPKALPQKGDVMLWNANAGGGYGHVAIFIEGDLKKFISFDQNWPTLSVCTKTDHTYTNVLGWLRPNNLPEVEEDMEQSSIQLEDDISSEIEEALKLKSYSWYDKHWMWSEFLSAINTAFKSIETAKDIKAQFKALKEQMTPKENKIANQAQEIDDLLEINKQQRVEIARTKDYDSVVVERDRLRELSSNYIAKTTVANGVIIIINAIKNNRWK